MRKKPPSLPAVPRHPWIIDARRRTTVFSDERRALHWEAPVPILRRLLRAVGIASFLLVGATDARASFDTIAMSAQAAAMGGASLNNHADSAALFLNPAESAALARPEAYMAYDRLYAGLNGVGAIGQGFLALGVPTRVGTLGVGVSDFQASGLLNERVVGLSWSRRWFGAFDAGVTAKYLHHSYQIGGDALAAADPVFKNGTSRGAFALDLGVGVPISPSLRLGLAVRNLNQPDVGLATTDRVAREVQAGLSYDFDPAWELRGTADYTYKAVPSGTLPDRSTPALGLEKGFVDGRVKFRVGVTMDQFSAGVGIAFGPATFDYAFILNRNLVSNNAGTQQVGIRYRFGDASKSASKGE
jgi:hypothetical protein